MPKNQFGSLLKAFREHRGLSQAALAESAGYSNTYMSRLENGQRFPSFDAVVEFAAGLGLTHDERIALLHAAGYVIDVLREPTLGELDRLFADPRLDPVRRANAASVVTSLLDYLSNGLGDAPKDANKRARRDDPPPIGVRVAPAPAREIANDFDETLPSLLLVIPGVVSGEDSP